jgi:putative transposase
MDGTNSSKYFINYHFVWCPKYRKPALTGEVSNHLKTVLEAICSARNWKILELQVMPDHIHLFLSAPPFDSPTGIIKVLKGISALHLFKKFKNLKQAFRRGHIWSPSYYVGTAGTVSAETIKKYIQGQTNRNSSPEQVQGSPCEARL